jgi:hypothetical protein
VHIDPAILSFLFLLLRREDLISSSAEFIDSLNLGLAAGVRAREGWVGLGALVVAAVAVEGDGAEAVDAVEEAVIRLVRGVQGVLASELEGGNELLAGVAFVAENVSHTESSHCKKAKISLTSQEIPE